MTGKAAQAERLAGVKSLTDAVQAAINAGEWLEAAALDQRRRRELEALLEQVEAKPELAPRVAQVLEELATQTRHMIGEVHHHQRRIAREASTVATGRRATQLYASVSADSGKP